MCYSALLSDATDANADADLIADALAVYAGEAAARATANGDAYASAAEAAREAREAYALASTSLHLPTVRAMAQRAARYAAAAAWAAAAERRAEREPEPEPAAGSVTVAAESPLAREAFAWLADLAARCEMWAAADAFGRGAVTLTQDDEGDDLAALIVCAEADYAAHARDGVGNGERSASAARRRVAAYAEMVASVRREFVAARLRHRFAAEAAETA